MLSLDIFKNHRVQESYFCLSHVPVFQRKRHVEQIVATGQADAVLMAREMPRDPYWPLHAGRYLNTDLPWPLPYERAKPE
jgi:2,4-dienoyl-CoA reductase-like NADH-dependent reductase (Old Yellow Enzyme family)